MPYRLFSHTNSTGSFHSAAMFSVSWNTPWLLAASPRKQMAISSPPFSWIALAMPAASGKGPPTSA